MRSRTTIVLATLLAAAACSRAVQVGSPAAGTTAAARVDPEINDGESLIRAMHARYDGKWYRTLTFWQRTTITAGSTKLNQVWYEAASLPGKLRIDTDTAKRSGSMYRNDSVYSWNEGRLGAARKMRNNLLVFGFDVYAQPPATTVRVAREEGYDLGRFHESTWQGKPVYVMGAERGDTTSKQLWVEKDRLLAVRWIDPLSPTRRSDFRFNKYEPHGGGWVAVEAVQFVNGRESLREEYEDVRVNVTLDPAVFDPAKWTTTPWWRRQR
jgi:hypothetical protein